MAIIIKEFLEKNVSQRLMLIRTIGFIVLFSVVLAISSCRNKTEQAPALNKRSERDALVVANSNNAIPRDEILHADNSLIDLKALSVVVTVEGRTEISESAFQSDMESRLKAAGLSVVPMTEEGKFPLLQLNVRMQRWSNGFTPSVLYALSLGYYRLFPNPIVNRPEKYLMGMTWSQDYSGTMPAIQVASIRGEANKLTTSFIDAFKRVNSAK